MRRIGLMRYLVLGVAVIFVTGAGLSPEDVPDDRYHDYDEILAKFDQWDAQYPGIFHREIIGHTLVGNEPIWAAKISDRAYLHEAEPRLYFDGAIHANEANGTNAILFMIERLLSRYGTQSYYTNMVDNLEMWFIPVVNVDGYRMVFAGGTNWDWWRKSKRDNDDNGYYTYPMDGVDCNRNWDFKWAQYDQTQWWSTRYKGPSAWSEPCVAASRDLILRERPVFVMNFHSPDVVSIANKIWWPWWDPQTYQYGPDHYIFQTISTTLGNRCQTEVNGVYVDGYNPAYNTIPKQQCWAYANTGICSFLMEISRQFWWTGSMVDTIAARTGRGNFYLMERALSGPGLKGFVTQSNTGAALEAEVLVQQVHSYDVGPRMTEQYYGQYWRLLNAGSYTVTFSAPNHYPETHYSVYVSSSGWTTLSAQLDPYPQDAEPEEAATPRLLWADTPLRAGSRVHFYLGADSEVTLDLLDVGGRHIATLMEGWRGAGSHHVSLRRGLPAGGYVLRLRAGSEQMTEKVFAIE